MAADIDTNSSSHQILNTHTLSLSGNVKADIKYEQHEDGFSLLKPSSSYIDTAELEDNEDCCSNIIYKLEEEEEEEEEVRDDDDKNVSRQEAPDGGYGWFVVLGCFIAHVVLAGLDRSEGIFFLLLTTRFEHSAQLTSWPGAIVCTLQLVLGPLANILSNRFSIRVTVMLGGAFMFLGLFLNSFASNIYLYFISHALISGLGRGIAYIPGLVIVGMYFDKRSGLATGIATSGSGIGTFVIVPLSQYLADNYGFKGIFLILGGFACHIFISAMLYRPLSMYYQSITVSERCKVKYNLQDKNRIDKHKTRLSEDSDLCCATSIDNGYEENVSPTTDTTVTGAVQGPIYSLKPGTRQSMLGNNRDKNPNSSKSAFSICCPIEHKSRQSLNLCRIDLLKNQSFLMYCLSIFMFTMSFRAAFTFIPALMESKGISKSESALALSAAGAVDTFGRITTGFLLDLPRLRSLRLVLYNLVIFGVSLVAFLLPSLNTFSSFCVMSGFYGLLTGAYISQKSVVLADILDFQDVGSSLGILMVFQGLGSLLGPPLSGAFKDAFGSFDESFYLCAGLMIISGLLMVLCNIFNVLHKRKKTDTNI